VKRGGYVTETMVSRLERRVSERDRAIIETLDSLRLATTEQLRRLHFADLTRASAARQAPRTLARLGRAGILTALPRRVGGVRAGSAATVWSLDIAGQRLASACGPAGGIRTRRPWTPSLPFVAHRLAVSELYVDLTEAARTGLCELLNFEAEPLSWRRFTAPHGGISYVKPDAAVRLGVAEFEHGALVEIDRSTEARPTITRKCTAYRRYWEAGREQARFGYFPRVVFAVPTEERKAALVDVLRAQPEEAWPIFQVVLAAQLPEALMRGAA
jgi:hypothetical protein